MKSVSSAAFLISLLFIYSSGLAEAEFQDAESDSKAVVYYRKALELDPSDTETRYYLGIALLSQGDYEAGVKELLNVYPERTEEPEINFNIGYAYLQLKKPGDAFKYFDALSTLNSASAKDYRLDAAFLNLGLEYDKSGDTGKTLACFESALKINAENIRTYLALGSVYLKMGDNERAIGYLEKAGEIDGNNGDIIKMLAAAHNNMGVDYLGRKRYGEAKKEFRNVLEMDSSHLYATYYLGYICYLEKDYDTALFNLDKLTSLKIEDENLKKALKPLLFNLAAHYAEAGKYETALKILDRIVRFFPDYSKALYYAGAVAADNEDFDKAIEMFEKYLEKEPSDQDVVAQLGMVYDKAKASHFEAGKRYYDDKNYRDALNEFEKALLISPEFGAARKYRDVVASELEGIREKEKKRLNTVVLPLLSEGKALLNDGELLAAEEKLLQAKSLDPSNNEAAAELLKCRNLIDQEITRNLDEGKNYMESKKYYNSLRSFRNVVFYDPENESANEYIVEVRRLLDNEVDPYLRAGEKYIKDENYRKALERYERALDIDPENKNAASGKELASVKIDSFFDEYLGMARDYTKVKQFQIAKGYYNEALDLKPGDSVALAEIAELRQKMGSLKGLDAMLKDAQRALVKGKYNKAISGFSNVLKIDSGNSEATRGLKEASYRKQNRIDAMIAEAETLYENGDYHDTIDLCREIESLERGETRARKLLDNSKNAINNASAPHIARGKELFDKGDIDGAVISFKKALGYDPGNALVRRYLSRIDSHQIERIVEKEIKRAYLAGLDNYTKGKYEEALNEWRKVLELDSDHERALLNIDKANRKLTAISGG